MLVEQQQYDSKMFWFLLISAADDDESLLMGQPLYLFYGYSYRLLTEFPPHLKKRSFGRSFPVSVCQRSSGRSERSCSPAEDADDALLHSSFWHNRSDAHGFPNGTEQDGPRFGSSKKWPKPRVIMLSEENMCCSARWVRSGAQRYITASSRCCPAVYYLPAEKFIIIHMCLRGSSHRGFIINGICNISWLEDTQLSSVLFRKWKITHHFLIICTMQLGIRIICIAYT